ncbi:hypothetical protein [Mycobacterium scrofulaceum]|uniref:hypothetical protein n=1 Tax=Mycobacterium scrofulaceum TaxID=1783 RepID=UPI000AF9E693|nr:hypothetical protein [Mycobacterium scrofulaceum]
MTDSQKWAAWLVVLAVVFLALAFFGEAALLAAVTYVVVRFVVIGGMVGLIGLALRKAG